MKRRTEGEITESKEQNVFRPGRSLTDAVVTLKNLVEKPGQESLPLNLSLQIFNKPFTQFHKTSCGQA